MHSDGIVLIVSKLSDNIAKFCKLLPDTANDLYVRCKSWAYQKDS